MQQTKTDLTDLDRRIAAQHEVLLRATAAKPETTYTCSIGSIVIAAAFVWTKLVLNDMEFSDGTNLGFDGSGWGAGLGGATLYGGAGTFNVPPSQLGDAKFQVTAVGGVAAGIQITFWDGNGNYLGVCGAAGLGVVAGEFGGSGDFSKS